MHVSAKSLSAFSYAEIRVERGTESTVRIVNGEVKATAGSYAGMSARVLERGAWGFASSNGNADVRKLLGEARRMARLESGAIGLRAAGSARRRLTGTARASSTEEMAQEMLDAGKGMDGRGIISRTLSCTERQIEKEFYNSEGTEVFQKMDYAYLSCVAVARERGIVQRGSETAASRKGFAKLDCHKAARTARRNAEKLLHAKLPPKGTFTVVLDNEMTGVFAHEALGHAAEADSIVDRESILANRMGEQLGSGLVNIVDDPTADDFGRYSYDDEGVRAKRVQLVKDGKLSGFLTSRETADALGMEANGHAKAAGFDCVPVVRMSNTYVLPGKSSRSGVFDVRKGIYLKGMKGGSVDTFSGGFMFKAEEAYEIRNGECGDMLRDVTISGNILETLRNVRAVGRDFGTSPGICGKAGQEAPVSDGGPHVQVAGMRIG